MDGRNERGTLKGVPYGQEVRLKADTTLEGPPEGGHYVDFYLGASILMSFSASTLPSRSVVPTLYLLDASM